MRKLRKVCLRIFGARVEGAPYGVFFGRASQLGMGTGLGESEGGKILKEWKKQAELKKNSVDSGTSKGCPSG